MAQKTVLPINNDQKESTGTSFVPGAKDVYMYQLI